ncbi:hypothetical protein G7Z17_g1453 [Cylindrodendrum hubeiense]|uniref:Uncharacterized protein n=1 Tax=Cylindrodendrum hubeiense TaxID=595255 RepID=A0A9P5LCG8_9HYPO|nr:hypothetical protein G7Z17_g1453 [Cylindrodendrum hubeiense]
MTAHYEPIPGVDIIKIRRRRLSSLIPLPLSSLIPPPLRSSRLRRLNFSIPPPPKFLIPHPGSLRPPPLRSSRPQRPSSPRPPPLSSLRPTPGLPDDDHHSRCLETTTTQIPETTTTAQVPETTTESSISAPTSDSTSLPASTTLTTAVEDPATVTVTNGPTTTALVPATQTQEAKDAVSSAYALMAVYVNNPTQDNAQKAKDETDNALALVTGVGAAVSGFGALIGSIGSAATSLAGAVSTPGAATAAAVSAAMSQVKEDLDDSDEDEDDNNSTEEEEPSSTEEEASSTTAEESSTTEASTTETTTTASTELAAPTFAYDYVTEAAGGSDAIVSALAAGEVPALACMSEFVLPITACAMRNGGGLDGSTTTTGTPTESTTAISTETTTAISTETTTAVSTESTVGTPIESTTVTSIGTPSTFVTSTRSSQELSDTTPSESATEISTETTTDSQTVPSTTPGTTTLESTTETTSEAPERTYYPCVNHGGPNVATPYCQCSTTTAGQTFFATATLIDGQCADYTSFPSEIPTVITTAAEAPVTQAPVAEPVTLTEDGTVLVYPSRTYEYGEVYTGIKVTITRGVGTPVTVSTPVPTETSANNKGSSQCGSIDDACVRAYEQFEDDTIYTEFTSRYSRIKSGFIIVATFGQAGCVAEFDCDDFGIGMSGKLIKEA